MKDVVAWQLGKARKWDAHGSQGGQGLKKQDAAMERSDTMKAQTCHQVQPCEAHGFYRREGSVKWQTGNVWQKA